MALHIVSCNLSECMSYTDTWSKFNHRLNLKKKWQKRLSHV